jgi:hypothetical protein
VSEALVLGDVAVRTQSLVRVHVAITASPCRYCPGPGIRYIQLLTDNPAKQSLGTSTRSSL